MSFSNFSLFALLLPFLFDIQQFIKRERERRIQLQHLSFSFTRQRRLAIHERNGERQMCCRWWRWWDDRRKQITRTAQQAAATAFAEILFSSVAGYWVCGVTQAPSTHHSSSMSISSCNMFLLDSTIFKMKMNDTTTPATTMTRYMLDWQSDDDRTISEQRTWNSEIIWGIFSFVWRNYLRQFVWFPSPFISLFYSFQSNWAWMGPQEKQVNANPTIYIQSNRHTHIHLCTRRRQLMYQMANGEQSKREKFFVSSSVLFCFKLI